MSYVNGIGSAAQQSAAETAAATGSGKTTKAESASTSVQAQSGFSATISADQSSVSATASAVAQALSGSDVRTQKVAALQQSIAAGTYSISSSNVAASVLNALLK